MSKKTTNRQSIDAPVFAYTDEEERIPLLASMKIEDSAPEDLCFCGEPINELGCGRVICDEEKPEGAQYLPIPAFICKIKH